MGSVFAVPIVVEPDFQTVREWARSRQLELVGTSGAATHDHWNREWQRPVGIVLGNEGDGLPDEIMAELDDTVRIPMTGTVESLNLGIAAGVLMYEVQRGLIS
jgi:TrmH family RNA methyltransferase